VVNLGNNKHRFKYAVTFPALIGKYNVDNSIWDWLDSNTLHIDLDYYFDHSVHNKTLVLMFKEEKYAVLFVFQFDGSTYISLDKK